MASALAVEILATLYNHPDFFNCPAYKELDESSHDTAASILGVIPHQLRGNLGMYGLNMLHGVAYSKCTACSPAVVDAYLKGGVEFILKCLNEPLYLEDLTGLAKEKDAVKDCDAAMDWSDSD
jgi:ubiquitin-like modifier-activating enzyme ATG7